MQKQKGQNKVVRLLQGGFSLQMLGSIFLLWAMIIPTCSSTAEPYTGLKLMREFPFLFLAPVFAVVLLLVSVFVRKYKSTSLRILLILLRGFFSLLSILTMHLAIAFIGTADKFLAGFYLFYFSLVGIFSISVYQLIADRREFIGCLREEREDKSPRTNLAIVSTGMYIISGLTLIGYIALNAFASYGYFKEELEFTPMDIEFMSASISGLGSIVILILMTFLLAYFVRRAHRWAGILTIIFALVHSLIGISILMLLSTTINVLEKIFEQLGTFLFGGQHDEPLLIFLTCAIINPVTYFFIYSAIALIFIEKILRKKRTSSTPHAQVIKIGISISTGEIFIFPIKFRFVAFGRYGMCNLPVFDYLDLFDSFRSDRDNLELSARRRFRRASHPHLSQREVEYYPCACGGVTASVFKCLEDSRPCKLLCKNRGEAASRMADSAPALLQLASGAGDVSIRAACKAEPVSFLERRDYECRFFFDEKLIPFRALF